MAGLTIANTTAGYQVIWGLLLGIEQIVAYVESNKLTLEETLVKYDKLTKHMLKTEAGSHTPHTLDTLWELQFEEIKQSPAAAMLGLR